jgi:hypothetical protein
MAKELHRKLGSMEYDGLITGLNPPTRVDGGVIAKLAEPAVLKRGTLLGKGESGLLSVYDGTGTPDCILCDDTEVGSAEDAPVDVYAAGCFDPEKVTVAEDYTITQADKDKLRAYSIVFKAATPAP